MLENIALIASIISALTAVTTSLRAVGVSQEYSRCEMEEKLKNSCRIGSRGVNRPATQLSSLRLHLAVTAVWYFLAIIFSVPFFIQKIQSASSIWLIFWLLSFLLLVVVICLIWKKAMKKSGSFV
jgi:hypothetical protein